MGFCSRLPTGLMIAFLTGLLLTLDPAIYQAIALEESSEWSEFAFDSSSDSYKKKRERAFDLRSGRYAPTEYTRTHSGDFIVMTGYNPKWVTFRTMDWIGIRRMAGRILTPLVHLLPQRVQ